MAKISLRVFQKGKPIFWIIGAVVVFVLFYLMANRRSDASAGGGMTVVQSGASEAMQIAGMQTAASIQTAQIGASVEAARIQGEQNRNVLASQVAIAQLMSGERVALETISADREAANLNAATNLAINEQNTTYALESARLASETSIGLKGIDAAIVMHQLDTNAEMFGKQLDTNAMMFAEQSRNLIATTALGQIQTLKKKNRDEALISLVSSFTGQPNTYIPQRDFGFGISDIVGVLSPAYGALH